MIDISQLRAGDKVHYQPNHFDDSEWENGVVKSIPGKSTNLVFVVYHCDGNWNKYQDYTAALTDINDLKKGWRT